MPTSLYDSTTALFCVCEYANWGSFTAPQEKGSNKTKSPSSIKYFLALSVSSIISIPSVSDDNSLLRICNTFCSHPADCLPASPFRRARGERHPTRPVIAVVRNLAFLRIWAKRNRTTIEKSPKSRNPATSAQDGKWGVSAGWDRLLLVSGPGLCWLWYGCSYIIILSFKEFGQVTWPRWYGLSAKTK